MQLLTLFLINFDLGIVFTFHFCSLMMSGVNLKAASLRSDVWDHFEKGKKAAQFKHCDKELSLCRGTTNL